MWWRPPAVYRLVIVNLKHDSTEAIRGVLWERRGSWLVLREAALIKQHSEPSPVDGEVLVHTDNVAFIQVVP